MYYKKYCKNEKSRWPIKAVPAEASRGQQKAMSPARDEPFATSFKTDFLELKNKPKVLTDFVL